MLVIMGLAPVCKLMRAYLITLLPGTKLDPLSGTKLDPLRIWIYGAVAGAVKYPAMIFLTVLIKTIKKHSDEGSMSP